MAGPMTQSPSRTDPVPAAPSLLLPRALKAPRAAEYLGISETKLRTLVAEGRAPRPRRLDGCVTWDVRDLDAFYETLPRDGEPDPEQSGDDGWTGIAL